MIGVFFFIGLFIGSFLLVVIERFPRQESILFGRSHCDMCGRTLAWYDLIPLLSYIQLHGKCRYCHKAYGLQYPIVEITTAGIFTSIPIFFPSVSLWQYTMLGILMSTFIVVFFCDFFYGLIPDIALLIALFASAFLVSGSFFGFLLHIFVGVCSFVFFLALYFGTKRKGMGLGDVKLAFVMGFLLGYPSIILALYLAFLTGAAVALILIVSKKRKFHGGTISFGPFLILGTYSSLIGGIFLWNFFLNILLKP